MRQMVKKFGVLNSPKNGEVIVEFVSAVPVITPKGKSYLVEMKPEHLQFGVSGYVPAESELGEIFRRASETKTVILARFEKHRKKGVDVNIPIEELTANMNIARENINKSFCGVFNKNTNKWDMMGGDFPPENDTEEMIQCVRDITKEFEKLDVDGFFEEKKAPTIKSDDFDKSQVVMTLYYTLIDYENKNGFSLDEEQRRAVTVKLLKLCDEIQKVILKSDQVDYRDYSHVRARFLVFSYAEKIEPITPEVLNNINNWLTRCLTKSKHIIEWSETV